MKQIFLSLAVIFALLSCSSDNDNTDDPQQHVITQPPVGTWQSGEYLLTFKNGYYAAYLEDDFIDGGTFEYDETTAQFRCHNPYFNKHTTYNIIESDNNSMKLTVSYSDVKGNPKSKTMSFTKANLTTFDADYYVGHSYSEQKFIENIETYRTTTYTTRYAGVQTTTYEQGIDYPIDIFYIHFGKDVYYQQFNHMSESPIIVEWNDEAGTGIVIKKTHNGR